MFLAMLDKYTEQGRNVSAATSRNYAPKVFADDKACGFSKVSMKDAMDRLLDRNEISTEVEGPPSRPVRRLVRA